MKKRLARCVAVILVVVLMISASAITFCGKENTSAVVLSDNYGYADEQVELTISIPADTDLGSARFDLVFDASLISPVISSVQNNIRLVEVSGDDGMVLGVDKSVGDSGFVSVGIISANTINRGGAVASISFTVSDQAEGGTIIPITMTVIEYYDGNDVDNAGIMTVKSGVVRVADLPMDPQFISPSPDEPEVSAITPSSAFLKWNECGPEVAYYNVYLESDSEPEIYGKSFRENFSLEGLVADTEYIAYISTVNENGESALSDGIPFRTEKANIRGDIDLSGGTPTIADALVLFKHVAGVSLITNADSLKAAEIDGTAGITISDALVLFKYVAGIISEL